MTDALPDRLRADLRESGLTVYFCPVCKRGTGDRSWHPVGSAGLIPQTQEEHDCMKIDVSALVAALEAAEQRAQDAERHWSELRESERAMRERAEDAESQIITVHKYDHEVVAVVVNQAMQEAERAYDELAVTLTAAVAERDAAETRAARLGASVARWQAWHDEKCEELRAAEARADQLQAALTRIAENASAWHGIPPDMGHVRSLAVIAEWCEAALAAVAAPGEAKEGGDG